MKSLSILSIALLSSFACSTPALAAEHHNTAEQQALICPDQGGIASAASKITNHISYALLYAVKGQTGLTSSQLAEAEKQLELLMVQNPIITTSDQVKMVQIDYMQGKATYSMLLPLSREGSLQDLHALSDMSAKDSTVVTMHIHIDSGRMKTSIKRAWQLMTTKDTASLIDELKNIQSMVGNTEISKKPDYLGQIYDHMLLTDGLLKEGLVSYARFSLKHVKTTLKYYTSTIHDPKHSDQLRQLKLSVDTLSEELEWQKPAMLENIKTQVQQWIRTIKGWQETKPSYYDDLVKS